LFTLVLEQKFMTGALTRTAYKYVPVFSWLMNCPIVSDAFFSSDGKLFHADGRQPAEKLRGPKPTIFIFDVAKLTR